MTASVIKKNMSTILRLEFSCVTFVRVRDTLFGDKTQ